MFFFELDRYGHLGVSKFVLKKRKLTYRLMYSLRQNSRRKGEGVVGLERGYLFEKSIDGTLWRSWKNLVRRTYPLKMNTERKEVNNYGICATSHACMDDLTDLVQAISFCSGLP